MTTLVVVKKAGQVAIAADTLVTFGDTSLGHRLQQKAGGMWTKVGALKEPIEIQTNGGVMGIKG